MRTKLLIITCLLFVTTLISAQTRFVDATATGLNNGTSWANAYTDLQDAIQNAISQDEIWIAQGTYTPSTSLRSEAFYLFGTAPGLKIYGGFNGTESVLSQRDIVANPTILSGDLLGNDDTNVTFNNATRTDNSYHVMIIQADNILIDGLTITSGYADGTSGINRFGAGILVADVSLNFELKNSIIKDNVAFWGSGLATYNLANNSSFILENCTFDNNLSSSSGSAFYFRPFGNFTMDISVVNCLIKNNKTTNNGSRIGNGASAGYIRAFNNNTVVNATIVNNTIVNNSNEGTGNSDFAAFGLSNQNGSFGTVTIANNIFWGNTKRFGTGTSITTFAFGKITDTNYPSTTTIYNSIDEDDFSNFTNKVATSNSNPLFTTTSDFTLQSGSPAIDSGDNSKVPSTIMIDILGNVRIHNTTVDMGAYEFGSATLGINDTNQLLKTIKLYPNPIKDILNIELENTLEKVEIYTIQGQKVLESNQKTLQVFNLSKGLYLLKIYTQDGKIGVKRFVKK